MREEDLVLGLQRRDRRAWLMLYDDHSQLVWRYVGRLIGPSHTEIGDIVQETFMIAAEGAGKFDGSKGTIRQWLLGIAHHRVAAFWRKAKQQRAVIELCAQEPSEQADPLAQSELSTAVRVTLASLPVDYADLLLAKYVDQLSVQEIVDRGGSSVESVRSRIARARKAFRVAFKRVSAS